MWGAAMDPTPCGRTSDWLTTKPQRRGKPVKKLRLIPAESVHAIARTFQGTPGTTVSVI